MVVRNQKCSVDLTEMKPGERSSLHSHSVRSELFHFLDKGAVLDGRDIGSVILPDADLKIFVTARQSIRVQRRFEELKKYNDSITLPQVLEDLSKRDWLDTTRENAPLKLSSDAHLIDTTELSIEASIASVIKLAEEVKNEC